MTFVKNASCVILIVAIASICSSIAWAGHGGQGQSPETPRTSAALDLVVVGFTLEGHRGVYHASVFRGEYAMDGIWNIGLQIPFYVLALRDTPIQVGLGDLVLSARFWFLRDENFALTYGLDLEVPTGNRREGFGSGHVEAVPFVSGRIGSGRWSLRGRLALSTVIGNGHGDRASIVFAGPHGDTDLVYGLGVNYRPIDRLFGDVGFVAATALSEEEHTFAFVTSEVGVIPSSGWRIAVTAGIPIMGENRFDWQIGATIQLDERAFTSSSVRREFQIAPWGFVEVNLEMQSGSRAVAEYESADPVEWNVHSHPNEWTVVVHDTGRSANGQISFWCESDNTYSFLWENRSGETVRLDVDLTLRDQVVVDSWVAQ